MTETDATRCVVCGGPFSEVRIHIDGRTYHQRCSYMSHPSHTWEDYARLSDECERLREALRLARNDLTQAIREIDRELTRTPLAVSPAESK